MSQDLPEARRRKEPRRGTATGLLTTVVAAVVGLLTAVATAGLLTTVATAGLLTTVATAGLLATVATAGLLTATVAAAGLLTATAAAVGLLTATAAVVLRGGNLHSVLSTCGGEGVTFGAGIAIDLTAASTFIFSARARWITAGISVNIAFFGGNGNNWLTFSFRRLVLNTPSSEISCGVVAPAVGPAVGPASPATDPAGGPASPASPAASVAGGPVGVWGIEVDSMGPIAVGMAWEDNG